MAWLLRPNPAESGISNSGTGFGILPIFIYAHYQGYRASTRPRDWLAIMRLLRIAVSTFLAGEALFVNAQEQKPLTGIDEPPSSSFEVRGQSPDLCDAGSRQWTGTVNVTADKSMFFCVYAQPQGRCA